MSAGSDGRANSGGEAEDSALLPNSVVQLAERGAGVDPDGLVGDVDGDGAELEHVEDDEGGVVDVGNAGVVVAAAADLELEAEGLGADDGGLDVGLVGGGDDEEGLVGGGGVEAGVADVRSEDGSVRTV